MDTFAAVAMGQANRGKEMMVFDWDRAARLIAESKPQSASAGLSGDWGCTGDEIYADGKIIPDEDVYTYLASTWAEPELEMDGKVIACFLMESECGWDSGTYWPESARAILAGEA